MAVHPYISSILPCAGTQASRCFFFQHKMYIRKGHTCYICTLSAQERIDVHSDAGITSLEVGPAFIGHLKK